VAGLSMWTPTGLVFTAHSIRPQWRPGGPDGIGTPPAARDGHPGRGRQPRTGVGPGLAVALRIAEVPWLEPDINDHLRRSPGGVREVVVSPSGSSPTTSRSLGPGHGGRETAPIWVAVRRAATPGSDPRFVGMVRDLILGASPGRAGPAGHAAGVGRLPVGCCQPPLRVLTPRRPPPPATIKRLSTQNAPLRWTNVDQHRWRNWSGFEGSCRRPSAPAGRRGERPQRVVAAAPRSRSPRRPACHGGQREHPVEHAGPGERAAGRTEAGRQVGLWSGLRSAASVPASSGRQAASSRLRRGRLGSASASSASAWAGSSGAAPRTGRGGHQGSATPRSRNCPRARRVLADLGTSRAGRPRGLAGGGRPVKVPARRPRVAGAGRTSRISSGAGRTGPAPPRAADVSPGVRASATGAPHRAGLVGDVVIGDRARPPRPGPGHQAHRPARLRDLSPG
jgi:hypothetical protein